MRRSFLQLLTKAGVIRVGAGVFYFLLITFLFCGIGYSAAGAVAVTAASNGVNICSNKAVGGAAPAFTTLGTITITEGTNSDISGASGGITNTIVLNAPTGWQFNSVALPSFSFITGSNITSVTGSITSSTLTIYITANNTNNSDQVFINGLQVQATSTSSAAGNIYASSVSGVAGIVTGSSGTNFATLSPTAPLTPSVTIAASPGGAICPGVPITFTPTAINGGTSPSFQWLVNGGSVAAGSSYITSTLASGNTVSCILTSSLACVTSTTGTSNIVTMTVNPAPAAITGAANSCQGSTSSLASTTTGGTWSSSAAGVATVSATGVVTGVAPGTAIISYTVAGCASIATFYVNLPPLTPSVSPSSSTVCNGSVLPISAVGTPLPASVMTQNFNSGVAPWTVDNTGSAGTVTGAEWKSCGDGYVNEQGLYHSPDNSGFVMSNSDTSGSMSYTSSQLISPVFSLVGYSSATLSFQHAYEAWTGDINVKVEISADGGTTWATLRSYLGSSAGTRISFATEVFSLNSYLGQSNLRLRFYYYCHWGYYWAVDNVSVTGTSSLAIPSWAPTTYLFMDSLGTTPYIAGSAATTVYMRPTGVGAVTPIVYTATATIASCSASATSSVTINPTPGVITGNANICIGSVSTLTDAAGGGTWASSNTGIVTVGATTGIITGVAIGTATISYIASTGCAATAVVTVNTAPAAISGSAIVCLGSTTTLSDITAGGTWVSTNPSVAVIGSGNGVVSPLTTGTTTITYSLGVGCTAVQEVTVNNVPSAISGANSVCMGQNITLSDATTGGTWGSNNVTIATAATGGVVTGVSAGNTTITYTVPGVGCYAVKPVTVNILGLITGPTNVCAAQTVTLANAYSGGTWSSSASSTASVNTTGVVTGSAAGVATISYVMPSGCTATYPFTVNPLPNAITGSTGVCQGFTTTLSSTTIGGSWNSSNTGIATVGSGNGAVFGVTPGTATITYMLPTGCYATATVTVNSLPSAISGSNTVCNSGTTTLSDLTTGGTWSSSNVTAATVGTATGIVTAGAAGPVTISYTLPTGCYATFAMTVNPLPVAVAGPSSVCSGSTITLSDATPGGTWTSSNATIANVGSASGVVAGYTVGMATITYVLPTGCFSSAIVSVNPLPAAISGTASVCAGSSVTLSDGTTGGTWSGGAPYASILSNGVLTGSAAGFAIITYTLPTGCFVVRPETVNALPAAITGTLNICVGATSSLTDASTGGTWTSGTTTAATIGLSNGVLNGVAAGTSLLSYILPTGCLISSVATVNALPAAITGPNIVCVASTITLDDASSGGTWSCSGTTVASINTSTGVLTGVGAGTTTVTYSVASGCISIMVVSVNGLPGAITGANTVCQGASTVLNTTSSGGTWTSSSTGTATVNAGTGIVTGGSSSGTVTISYTLPNGCYVTKLITVNAAPLPITGVASLCSGSITSLSSATTGGTWSSTNTGAATIGSTTGIVNGIGGGSAIIYYTLANGCSASKLVTVNPLPGAITGNTAGCTGTVSTLVSATSGGTWTSSNTAVATIGAATGEMTGIAVGTTRITYTLSTGCFVSTVATISTSPTIVSGPTAVCLGSAAFYTDATSGGTWSSSNTLVAGIGSASGFLTGYAAGAATISYTIGTGCSATLPITINVLPAAIAGISSICQGLTTTFSDATPGGSWSSSNMTVATVGTSTGIITASAPGTTAIYYTMPTGCAVSKFLTVNAAPTAITGSTSICQASTSTLANTVSGGTWSSSTTSVASVGSATGVVASLGVGTSNITYSTGTGCFAVATVTVNVSPAAIIGLSSVCQGSTMTLSCTTTGGVWSSSNTAIATVGTGGAVTGVSPGTATISYGITVGCSVTRIITVNSGPAPISGVSVLCTGGSLALTDGSTGGTWSSNNTSVASIGSNTGVLTANTIGTATISYTLSNGCATTYVFTINDPAAITGVNTLCVGTATTLNNINPSGSWSSNAIAVATIGGTTGIATGVAGGTATISYNIGTGCRSSTIVTVYPAPAEITGPAEVCAGASITLDDATAGGTWSSSDNSIATVGLNSGVVSAAAAGTVNVTYTTSTGCVILKAIAVNPLPPVIGGTGNVCLGAPITLTEAATGGTWSSSDAAVVSVGSSSGATMGYSFSTAIITYTLPTGCYITLPVSVNSLPASISGASTVCQALTMTLSDATTGGTWSTSDMATANVGVTSGIVTGFAPGVATISYIASTGCYVTKPVSVNTLPSSITGVLTVCPGSNTTLSNATTGGTWSSSFPGVASIGVTSGVVNGIATGTSTITYTPVTGCITTSVVTVLPLPSAIVGGSTVCPGTTLTLSSTPVGGSWASSATAIATVGAAGIVLGGVAGTTVITYTAPNSCRVTSTVTVNPLPAAIGGNTNLCVGFTSSLSDATAGGTWSSSDIAVASIGSSSGVLSGLDGGTSVISYTLPTGCFITTIATVNTLYPITGPNTLCTSSTATLTNATGAGTWTSSNTAVATIGATSGVVNGVAVGTATITFNYLSGCYTTMVVSVNVLTPITGTATVCAGSVATLSNAAAGATWTSSNPAVATIGSGSGMVTGVTAGTATIVCYFGSVCSVSRIVTVMPLPASITGLVAVCQSSTTTLGDATTGGTWSSGSTSTATIGSVTGIVMGAAAGVATISYILPTGCYSTAQVTVNPLPAAVTGSAVVCVGSTTTFADVTPGGTWSSSSGIASVDGAGVVTGGAAESATISYTLPTGCFATRVASVNPLPAAITGGTAICVGFSATLSSASAGGTWSSSNTLVATIGSSNGIVAGISIGSSVVTYTLPTGCIATQNVAITPPPSAVTGSAPVCVGSTITLADATAGGSWNSAVPSIATVGSSTGVVTGLTAGTTVVTYSVSTGCNVTTVVTVSPLPSAITGAAAVCVGSSVTLSSSPAGTWSSSPASIAAINSAGILSGIATGGAYVTYTLSTGCMNMLAVTVNPLPAAIAGADAVCIGSVITLSDGMSGGSWSSTSSDVSVGSVSGIVTGNTAGAAIVTYTLPTGCVVTKAVAVNPLPLAIAGAAVICQTNSATLTDGTAGGTWSSDDASIAIVGSTSGTVTGLSAGTVFISYKLSTGCYATKIFTVNPQLPIVGTAAMCIGTLAPLINDAPGGTWTSTNTAIATIGASTGLAMGVALGTSVISYTLPTGCVSVLIVTVNPVPTPISGSGSMCQGSAITLNNATPGGSWSSSASSIASVGTGTGIVTGIGAGTAHVYYVLSTGCAASVMVTVNPLQPIAGPGTLCEGASAAYLNSIPSGTWSSSTTSVATVDSMSGAVAAHSAGTAIISYMLSTGCLSIFNVTVNPLPFVHNVTGGGTYCAGGAGVPVGLNNSNVGVTYKLYKDTTYMGGLVGTGSALDFGLQTAVGLYTVIAINSTSGCYRVMADSAVVAVSSVVTPAVTIATFIHDSACFAMPTVFYAYASGGGSAPTYAWRVNGVLTGGAGSNYTYVPAGGDVVSCTIVSNATCRTADSATHAITVTVLPVVTPSVSLALTPGETVCPYTPVTLMPVPIDGGYAPSYTWIKNGVTVGTFPSYAYMPDDGDEVRCIMNSNAICRTVDTASSSAHFTIIANTIPAVTVSASPSLDITAGDNITFTADVGNAGPVPAYQWYINAVVVPGAISSSFSTTTLADQDTVSCVVTSSGTCAGIQAVSSAIVRVYPLGVITTQSGYNFQLVPNPNKGTFTLKGDVSISAEHLPLIITNILGQVVYTADIAITNNMINAVIVLPDALADGVYLLHAGEGNKSILIRFAISK